MTAGLWPTSRLQVIHPSFYAAARYIGKSREIGNVTNLWYEILVTSLICRTFANLRYIGYEILVTSTIY